MYSNYSNTDFLSHRDIFAKEAFSKREALDWLINNKMNFNDHGLLSVSMSSLANEWKWHKSKVARFLNFLRREVLIDTVSDTTGDTASDTAQPHKNQQIEKINETVGETPIDTDLAIFCDKTLFIKQNLDDCDTAIDTLVSLDLQAFQTSQETETDTNLEQNRDRSDDERLEKEEKKKRSKKRKEEIKEKPPLKGGKKEKKIFANQGFLDYEVDTAFDAAKNDNFVDETTTLAKVAADIADNINEKQVLNEILSKKPKSQPDSVVVEDVIDWAEKNLPTEINVEWELEKFKDYWRSYTRKPAKDAVAAFRNWLRRAIELKNKNLSRDSNKYLGGNDNGYNQNNATWSPDIERFFTGGIKALDSISRSRLEW